MMSFLRKYEVWCFLGLIIVANTLFVSGIVFDVLPQGLYAYGRFALLGAVLLGVVMVARGRAGLDDLLRPLLEWRRPPAWYLFALLWTPAVISAVSKKCVGFQSLNCAAASSSFHKRSAYR